VKQNARIALLVLLFVMVQVIGIAIAQHTNVHANIWPTFGLLLLVPGIIFRAADGDQLLEPSRSQSS
jgi:hypothetical protein